LIFFASPGDSREVMKPPLFAYRAPKTLDEAIEFLASDADAMVLAGGQSLMPAMNFRVASPSMLVDIQHVEGLKGIVIEGGEIVIKAMTRHRELELDPQARIANPLIAEVMQHVAHVPIRNRGTVVGSLCHADPSAELPLLFVLLGGTLVARGPDGTRRIAAADFFQSFLTTARRQDEIVVEARLPVLAPGAGWAFDEVTRRHGDFALAGVGCVLALDDSGRAHGVRLAACGIADRPARLGAAEAALEGTALAAGDLDAAVRASAAAVTQADDMNTSTAYRRRVLGGLIRRLIMTAAQRAGGGTRQ
jgi:CO/xanthine dehydrogenase FAD-binding subunit